MGLLLEQQGSCRAEGSGRLEGLGWSSREAAGKSSGGGGCCRGAAEAMECSGVASVHSGQ